MITQMFYTYNEAYKSYLALRNAGITEANISLISNDADQVYQMEQNSTVLTDAGEGAGIGGAIGGASGLLAGLGVIAIPGVGPVIAAGWLAATLAGMAAGGVIGATAGSAVGLLNDETLDKEETDRYAAHIRQGGSLVCVRGEDMPKERIEDILLTHRNQENQGGFNSFAPKRNTQTR